MSKLISIIVPVYNIELYIEKCVTSILEQSYNNFEILLIDDGSTDKSGDICELLAAKDSRIKVFHKKNGGLSDARNYGLQYMKGEYVCFIDSDDYVDKDYLKKLYEAIQEEEADVSLCSFKLVDENKRELCSEVIRTPKKKITGKELLSEVLTSYGYQYVVAWNKLYKAELFFNLKFEKGKLYEDEFINFTLFYYCSKVAIVHDSLYCYTQRQGSIMQSSMSIEKITTKIELHNKRLKFYYDNNDIELYNKAKQQYCNWIISSLAEYSELFSKKIIINLQKDFRKYALTGVFSNKYKILIRIQNILGIINIKIASYVRKKIMIN